jgi:hypothetical protein
MWSWAQNPQTEAVAAPNTQPTGALSDVPLGGAMVTYENGDLTIRARGAPLVEILRAVCTQTGAKLDFQSDQREPIFGLIGPGPVREVLTSLLLGSHVNYVIQASDADPMSLAQVMTFPNSTESDGKKRFEHQQQNQTYADSGTTGTAVAENSGAHELTELLAQAKADVASAAEMQQENGSNDEVDSAASAEKPDASIGKEAEAQLKAIENLFDTPEGADTPSPQTAQPSEVQRSNGVDAKTKAEVPPPFIPNRRRRK